MDLPSRRATTPTTPRLRLSYNAWHDRSIQTSIPHSLRGSRAGIAAHAVPCLSRADHIADKVSALLETHQRSALSRVASTRCRDLLDLLVLAYRARAWIRTVIRWNEGDSASSSTPQLVVGVTYAIRPDAGCWSQPSLSVARCTTSGRRSTQRHPVHGVAQTPTRWLAVSTAERFTNTHETTLVWIASWGRP